MNNIRQLQAMQNPMMAPGAMMAPGPMSQDPMMAAGPMPQDPMMPPGQMPVDPMAQATGMPQGAALQNLLLDLEGSQPMPPMPVNPAMMQPSMARQEARIV